MTAKKAATATKPRQAPKHIPDPPFELCEDRPKDIITSRGINAPPPREAKPLTAAVLKTVDSGGTVKIKYAKAEHDRLMGRFKGIESRDKTLVFKYSLELDPTENPTHVRYWCEKKAPAPPPPAPPPSEARVGVDVE